MNNGRNNNGGGGGGGGEIPEHYLPLVPFELNNIYCTASNGAHVTGDVFFRSQNLKLTTLHNRVTNPEGVYRRKVLIMQISGVTLAKQTQPNIRTRTSGNQRGVVGQSNAHRYYFLSCHSSNTVPNTCVVMEGNGHGTTLFSHNLPDRDNGKMCECTMILCWLLFF